MNVKPERPRINCYVCNKCGWLHWTIDREPGVTPGMIRCRRPPQCDGLAWSAWYRVRQDDGSWVDWEWYRPGKTELCRFDAATREHIAKGGLILRRRKSDGKGNWQ